MCCMEIVKMTNILKAVFRRYRGTKVTTFMFVYLTAVLYKL